MKKFLKFFSLAALVLVISACGGNSTKDGSYQAMDAAPGNGWTYFLTFDVKDGQMTNFNYDAVDIQNGNAKTKSAISEAGDYKLAPGNAGEWHEQAIVIEKWLEENQGLGEVTFNDEGKTDAVAGATIHFNNVETLLADALEAGPVEKGSLTDGVYYAEGKKDDKGFIATLGYFVNNGVILGAHVDGYQMTKVDGKDTKAFKTQMAIDGKYDLESETGAYNEQAIAVADHIVANQGFGEVEVNDEGKTDAITGATISVQAWIDLFDKAVKL